MAEPIRQAIERVDAIGNEHTPPEGERTGLPEGALALAQHLGIPYDELTREALYDDVVESARAIEFVTGEFMASAIARLSTVWFMYGVAWEQNRGE